MWLIGSAMASPGSRWSLEKQNVPGGAGHIREAEAPKQQVPMPKPIH